MTLRSPPAPLTLLGTALLGALAGAAAGALVSGRADSTDAGPRPAEAPRPASPDSLAVDVEGLERLLATLVEEVRGLRATLASERRVADPGDADSRPTGPARIEELVAALESLTRALQSGGGSAFGLGGRGLPVIDVPSSAARLDLLQERRAIEDDFERVRPFLLWNYQQALDHFGPPTAVHQSGNWTYRDPAGGREITLMFRDGLLIGIW